MTPSPFDLNLSNLLVIPGMLIGFTIHELGHALVAYFLGDHSQVEEHKISLNPLEHVSWIGAFAFIFFGLGWPKSMQVNPYNLKQRNLDLFWIAIAGPLASITLALAGGLITLSIAAAVIFQSGATTDQVFAYICPYFFADQLEWRTNLDLQQALTLAFTGYITITSLALTFMSLLPFPGQDGFTAVVSLVAHFRRDKSSPTKLPTSPTSSLSGPLMPGQVRLRDNAADIHFKIGSEYHTNEQFDDAIARYRQAISHDPNFGPAYINMGLAFLVKNNRQKAIQAFRGATQYADDERSQNQAWQQLQHLSEVSPVRLDEAEIAMAEMGALPWVDTKPRPNWLVFTVSAGLIVVSGFALYGYLVVQVATQLKG